jgi:hypothetical protein
MTRLLALPAMVLAIITTFALPAAAQTGNGFFGPPSTGGDPTQVLSTNPIGLMHDFYNAEYEVKMADAVTAGAGASRRAWYLFGESEEAARLNGDVFVRYYVWGRAFNGLAIGVKAGATRIPDEGTYAGVGWDLNHSYAYSDHAVASVGIGMKRLLGRESLFGASIVTTLRLNVGIGF